MAKRKTNAELRAIARSYAKVGYTETRKRTGASDAVIYRAARLYPVHGAGITKRKKSPPPRPNGLETVTLLREACRAIESEVRSGAPLRESDAYVRLALGKLQPSPPARHRS